MKILITGGMGFIATNLTQYLLKKGHTVIGCGHINATWHFAHPRYIFIPMDVRNPEDYTLLPKVDVIVHLAANVGVEKGLQHPLLDFETNTKSTVYLLEWARTHGKPLFIYASSNKVYPLEEYKSFTPYGISKRSSELWCTEYNCTYGVPTIINRQSSIYGEYQKGRQEQGWISWFMLTNLLDLPLTIFGNGRQIRDILYIQDFCKLLYTQMITKKMWGKIYNVGAGEKNTVSINELLKLIEYISGKKYKQIIYTNERKADQKIYVSDISKLLPYWKPTTNKEKGLLKTFEWLKKNV